VKTTSGPHTGPNATAARRIRVLVNPHAGAKGGIPTNRATVEDVRAVMERHGLGAEVIVTASAEEAMAAARDAVRQGYDVVVAAGGDGTIEPIASQLMGTETALAILPLGSWMNIARMLGISRNLDEAAALIAAGHIRTIDVGEAKGRLFFEGGSVGLNAAVTASTPVAAGCAPSAPRCGSCCATGRREWSSTSMTAC
jgi:diacylglycerol kinase family enzyme